MIPKSKVAGPKLVWGAIRVGAKLHPGGTPLIQTNGWQMRELVDKFSETMIGRPIINHDVPALGSWFWPEETGRTQNHRPAKWVTICTPLVTTSEKRWRKVLAAQPLIVSSVES